MANPPHQIPELVLARRPPPAQQQFGKPYESRVNVFKIRSPMSSTFHYDRMYHEPIFLKVDLTVFARLTPSLLAVAVRISPDKPSLPTGRAKAIVETWQLNEHFTPQAFYDGKANLFAFHDILGGKAQETYVVNMTRGTPVLGKNSFHVTLTLAQKVTPDDLKAILSGHRDDFPISTVPIQALNVLLQHSLQYTGDLTLKANLYGLDIFSGFFRSIRAMKESLYVNVDTAIVINYQTGKLSDLVLAFLGKNDARCLEPQWLYPGVPVWQPLRKFLKDLKVRQDGSPKIRVVHDLVCMAGSFEFCLKDGQSITVANYFKNFKNIVLQHPGWLGIKTRQKEVIPMECCTVVPRQRYKDQLSAEAVAKVLEVAKKRPDARFSAITSGVQTLSDALSSSPCLFQGDKHRMVALSRDPEEVRGHLLVPPQLKYGNMSHTPKEGSWNLAGDRIMLHLPGNIVGWGVVVFDSRVRHNDKKLDSFLEKLRNCMKPLGIKIELPNPQIHEGNPVQVANALAGMKKTAEKYNVDLTIIIVVLPDNAAEIKQRVKYWGDIKEGIATQCVKVSKIERPNDQYLKNLCLKINAKIKGINHIPVISGVSCIQLAKTMLIGIDVSHPGPGAQRPSVASVVGSVDKDLSYYAAATSIQEPRIEQVDKLGVMLKKLINDYHGYRGFHDENNKGSFPEHIIIFRDGVSEGELPSVIRTEINVVKTLLVDLAKHLGPTGVPPKLTFIVVGKRHHIRFAPLKHQLASAGRSGNCPPGYVVDDKISTPGIFDFYLQSHEGILGTSRPGHYIVIRDENNFSVDELKSFCFAICHTSARTTRSVSIPTPVLYADIVCQRGGYHFDPEIDLQESGSTASGEIDMKKWHSAFKPVHRETAKSMYFV